MSVMQSGVEPPPPPPQPSTVYVLSCAHLLSDAVDLNQSSKHAALRVFLSLFKCVTSHLRHILHSAECFLLYHHPQVSVFPTVVELPVKQSFTLMHI